MKDIVSKLTFGFLMAQLLPGAIALLFLTLPFGARAAHPARTPFSCLVTDSIGQWFEIAPAARDEAKQGGLAAVKGGKGGEEEGEPAPAGKAVAFFLAALGLGMVIHGINWMVLARLENGSSGTSARAIYKSAWHRKVISEQLLLGPLTMLGELLEVLRTPGIRPLAMEENAPRIGDSQSTMFTFIEDFYLNFAQFYAHTACALWIGTVCFAIYSQFHRMSAAHSKVGLVLLYFATSVMFLIGRVQFTSMCKAEEAFLAQQSPPPHPVAAQR